MMISARRAVDASSDMAVGFASGASEGAGLEARTRDALDALLERGVRISYPMVAEEAGVAKSTLYRNRAVARMVDEARAATRHLPRRQDGCAAAADALRREKAGLEAELARLREENLALKREAGELRARLAGQDGAGESLDTGPSRGERVAYAFVALRDAA